MYTQEREGSLRMELTSIKDVHCNQVPEARADARSLKRPNLFQELSAYFALSTESRGHN